MGQQITHEIGLLNIGRRVKVYGHSNKQHGMSSKLVGAEPKHAIIRIDNHDKDEKVEWQHVRDWTSHNATPLKMPPMKAAPIARVVLVVTHNTPAPMPTLPSAADSFAVYQTLGADLERAVGEVRAAEDLVDEALENLNAAKATHAEAVEKVRRLRSFAARALTAVDDVLSGTSAAA